MQTSYPYTATDQLLILSWAFEAGFTLSTQQNTVSIMRNDLQIAKIPTSSLFDRLTAEIAQIAAARIVFHMKEHPFVTLRRLQPATLRAILVTSPQSGLR